MEVRNPEIWLEVQCLFRLEDRLLFMPGTKQDLTFQCKHERCHWAQLSCSSSLGNGFLMSISERQVECIPHMRLKIVWAHLDNLLELGFRGGPVPQKPGLVRGNLQMRFGKCTVHLA